MSTFKFPVINSLLHNELRLKIMVALDNLQSASFMYLCEITDSTRGNMSVQLKMLQSAGYIEVKRSGAGSSARSTCKITHFGHEALHTYEQGLRHLFEERIPEMDDPKRTVAGGSSKY
jgi:DNA-binding transcriptional ArsR family regulator